jgi:colanic acid biosynthesis protein WcaH
MAYLSRDVFLAVIANTPLVSIDLIIRNADNAILVGRRINEPAKNYWFVPGGRIRKDETLEAAFARLTQHELGRGYGIEQAKLLGAFTHQYDNNALNEPGVTTHYVVLAYEIRLDEPDFDLSAQHGDGRWITRAQVEGDADLAREVHANVLPYLPTSVSTR